MITKNAIVTLSLVVAIALAPFGIGSQKASADIASVLGVQGLSDAEVAKIKRTIEAWTLAFVKDDLDTWDTYWAEDGILMPPGHSQLTNDTMRNSYIQSNFKDVANATFTAWAVVGRDDLAVVTNSITWEYESGGSPTTVKQLIVLRLHQDERWLIQSVIFNSSE